MLKCHLLPAFGGLFIDEITVERIDLFKSESRLASKTLHNQLTLLATLVHYAEELGWIARAPRIRKPRVPKRPYDYLRTQDEIGRFLRAAATRGCDLCALYATATYTGLRAGELAGLRWEDVDFDNRLVLVQRSYNGPTKNDQIRYVPILDALLPILRQWRLSCAGPIVFPNHAGAMHQPSARVFQEIFKQVLHAAGFPARIRNGHKTGYIRFHDLRHTFASHWVMNNGDLFKLQQILGHQSTQMTLRYAHLSPAAFAEDMGRFPSATGSGAVLPFASKAKTPCETI